MEDEMEIKPLGSGCEVGRSCVMLKFKGYTVMFDCGVHPAYTGLASLPYFDDIDPSEVDLLLVTHFHMDHCGAIPYFTEKTGFRGRIFMTHPTKAIYKILMHDAVRLDRGEDKLFDEKDMLASMEKIELMNYHAVHQHKGIKFSCYNAGHVLGACMFMVEIAGVRVLYTGDFSREEDRHLNGAEIPPEPPHVLIIESTYGVQLHDKREVRESRFCEKVHKCVARGGRCLIPVFALGRSQELLLILDEYWKQHPALHGVPIYYASTVAKKCMRVYQTYINMMNEHIIDSHARGTNPWEFQFVRNMSNATNFDDSQPMVIMASPGMMQSGLSRELFELWCSDKRNGLMMPGYSVAGTLAHYVMTEPKEITTSQGDRVPVNLSIDYISFSAHSDYAQTSEFVAKLRPAHVVLVHGGEEEMMRLQRELARQYDPKQTEFLTPRNCQAVQLRFRGDRIAKVVGSLAASQPEGGLRLDGLLLKKDFTYTLMAASHVHDATPLACTALVQRPRFRFPLPLPMLLRAVRALFPLEALPPAATTAGAASSSTADAATAGGASGAAAAAPSAQEAEAEAASVQVWRVAGVLSLGYEASKQLVQLEWSAGPVADMVADAVTATLLQLQATPAPRAALNHKEAEAGVAAAQEAAGEVAVKMEVEPPAGEQGAAARTAAQEPPAGQQESNRAGTEAAAADVASSQGAADEHGAADAADAADDAVRRLLSAHFGPPTAEAAERGEAATAEDGQAGGGEAAAETRLGGATDPAGADAQRVEVSAAGERVRVRPRLPLEPGAVECDDPEVAGRVSALLERVQRAAMPLS